MALASPTVAQPEDAKLAEIPEGLRVARDLIPMTNLARLSLLHLAQVAALD